MTHRANILLSLIILIGSAGCTENKFEPNKTVRSPEYTEQCDWSTAKLHVFNNQEKVVKFRYLSCNDEGQESVFVNANGNDIQKLTFDVVMGRFSIFEQGSLTQRAFVSKLINKNWEHDGPCQPKRLNENMWKIEDGKEHNAKINFMPCGRYGRNFVSEKVFVFKDGIVLNFMTSNEFSDIDFSSIEYQSERQP